MIGNIALIGQGELADLAEERLSREARHVVRTDADDAVLRRADLAVVLSDGWDPGLYLHAERAFRQAGLPWLRAFVCFGEGTIGPWVRPGLPGCSECADLRRVLAGTDRKEIWSIRQMRSEKEETIGRDPWGTRAGWRIMAEWIAREVVRFSSSPSQEAENKLTLIQLTTFTISTHFVLPDPHCRYCGRLPEDDARSARIELRASPKAGSSGYRTRPMEQFRGTLEGDYVDPKTGLLNGKMTELHTPFADASVNLPLFDGDEGCAGRTHSYADSGLTAILEGLERHCGTMPRGKRPAVRDSYRNLAAHALHPLSVGTHSAEQYRQADFPFEPFDPDRAADWVWGYSLTEERPLLVPETLAYYSTGGRGYVFETSNGCALGGSLEEAVFYGILEAVERDSFLLSWYARLPLPRLDPYSSGDPELGLMVDRLRAVAEFDVLLFNSTMEHGIPSIWSIAKNRTRSGVNLICAAGAHPDPVRAAKASVHELAAMVWSQNERFEANRQQHERMLLNPYLVRHMEDHSMLYALPQAEERLGFLLGGDRPLRTFGEEYRPIARHADLTDDLRDLLHSLRGAGMNVIVVDQTSPEISRNGLVCVKAILPGLLPMTFGYRLTRLSGLDRVLTVPAKLGYAERPLEWKELNPHPHPFP